MVIKQVLKLTPPLSFIDSLWYLHSFELYISFIWLFDSFVNLEKIIIWCLYGGEVRVTIKSCTSISFTIKLSIVKVPFPLYLSSTVNFSYSTFKNWTLTHFHFEWVRYKIGISCRCRADDKGMTNVLMIHEQIATFKNRMMPMVMERTFFIMKLLTIPWALIILA